jgi:hypothetical protein
MVSAYDVLEKKHGTLQHHFNQQKETRLKGIEENKQLRATIIEIRQNNKNLE